MNFMFIKILHRYILLEFKKMEKSKVHIRHCLLYEYQLGHTAAEAHRNISLGIGQGVLSQATAYRWFERFKEGEYSLEDEDKPGRGMELDVDRLVELVESDPRQTTRCLASALGCSNATIDRHLNELGYRLKLDVWVPHDLNHFQQNQRLDICMNFLTFKRTFNWLDHLITGDEKWVLYINYTRKHQWCKPDQAPLPTPKPEIHAKKILLSVWWDIYGVVYWEILPPNTTINAEVYCTQLENLKATLLTQRPEHEKIYFLHDNARPHIAKSVRKKLLLFGWELLPHPPYSPDLAPTDYHLFRSLSNHLREKIFNEEDDIEMYLRDYFDSQLQQFYYDGIHSLPVRWQEVVDNDGRYIID